jgi:hypothetical protein
MLDKNAKSQKTEDGFSDLELHWQDIDTHRPSKLPTELVYEIVNHVNNSGDAREVAVLSHGGDPYASNGRRDEDVRQSTLRALSQTSRMLRYICLPLLWERIILPYESLYWFRIKVDSDGCQVFLSKFEKIAYSFVENPTLAAYVRFVVQILTYLAHILRNGSCITIANIYPGDWMLFVKLDTC